MSIAIQRWFLDKNKQLRELSIELLRKFGTIFSPLTVHCRETNYNEYSCSYENLNKQYNALMKSLSEVHNIKIRTLIIHTEYEIPLWWDDKFTENYGSIMRKAFREIRDFDINKITIEIHPGFGGPNKSRNIEPIIDGIAKFVRSIIDDAREYGIDLTINVESRGSSSTMDKRPQAVATINELEKFRAGLMDRLKKEGFNIAVYSVLDIPQLIRAYAVLNRISKQDALKKVMRDVQDYVSKNGQWINELHIHWFRDIHRLNRPHATITKDIWDTTFKPIINKLLNLGTCPTIVPEVSPMVKTNDLVKMIEIINSKDKPCN